MERWKSRDERNKMISTRYLIAASAIVTARAIRRLVEHIARSPFLISDFLFSFFFARRFVSFFRFDTRFLWRLPVGSDD